MDNTSAMQDMPFMSGLEISGWSVLRMCYKYVISFLEVCYKCVMSELQMCYEFVTNLLGIWYKCVTSVLGIKKNALLVLSANAERFNVCCIWNFFIESAHWAD